MRGCGGGIIWVMSTQLLLQLVPLDVRGRIFSTEFALSTLGNAIAAGSVGFLLDTTFTMSTLIFVMAMTIVIPLSAWTSWVFFGTREKAKIG